MAADANRLAAALAYEDERKRRLAETIPALTGPTTAPRRSVRTDLENLSAGLGQGITTQLEGIKGLITDPVGTAKGAYEAARAVVRDPSVLAAALSQMGQKAMSGPLGAGEVIGEMIGPRKTGPVMAELDVYHGTPHRFPATETVDVYRGENASNIGGNYWSTNPEFAQQFTQRGLPEEVKRSTLSMSDVYSPPTPVFAGDAKAVDAAIAEAKKLGKSAVRFSEGKNQPDSFFVIEKAALGRKGNPLGEFDASKIGTGEGAQAYGHGVYLAESPGVAESYKKVLTDKKSADLWTDELRQQLPKSLTKKEFERFSDLNVKLSKNGNLSSQEMEEWRNFKDLQQKYDDAVGRLQPRGSLYKADLPDEMIDRMLDWDKPLSEQPAAVRAGVQSVLNKARQEAFDPNAIPDLSVTQIAKMNGAELHALMQRVYGSDASKEMRTVGIPGIKYADAGSRGQGGSGTRNFVVFPGEEKKVRILERK